MATEKNASKVDGAGVLLKILMAIAIVGALNWGLVGFFNWNLVTAIFGGPTRGEASALSRLIYSLVGIAGLVAIFLIPWSSRERIPAGMRRRAEVRP